MNKPEWHTNCTSETYVGGIGVGIGQTPTGVYQYVRGASRVAARANTITGLIVAGYSVYNELDRVYGNHVGRRASISH